MDPFMSRFHNLRNGYNPFSAQLAFTTVSAVKSSPLCTTLGLFRIFFVNLSFFLWLFKILFIP